VLLSFFLNILATEVFLNRLLRRVHLSLSRTISLIHCSHFFLSKVEEVVWGDESGIGVLFGLVVVFCGGRGIRIGDMEQDVFLGSNCGLVAATVTST